MPANRNVDLVVICTWAALTVAAVVLSDSQPLRLMLALPLLLLFSGHSVLRAVGPIASSPTEHAVYCVGVSIAVALAGGFVLNRLDALVPLGWALWLATAVAASAAIALWRQPMGQTYFALPSLPGLRTHHLAMIGIAAVLTYGAYALAVRDAANQREFKYTDFWMLSNEGAPGAVIVGIKSAETAPQLFDVEVTRGNHVVAVWRSVYLIPGETWTRELGLSVDGEHVAKIYARLYGHDDGRLYRQVSAIVPSADG